MLQQDEPDYKRVFLAVFLAALVLIGWQIKVEWPRRQALTQMTQANTQKHALEAKAHVETIATKESTAADENPDLTLAQRIAMSPRITVASDKLSGSIALKGARFDDLRLTKYHVTLDKESPDVTLLAPNGDAQSYFVQIGWLAGEGKPVVPDQNTLWTADRNTLTAGSTVNLRWKNPEGVAFILAITLDENYMFSVVQTVDNPTAHGVNVIPYAYINRAYEIPAQAPFLHEGPLGVMEGSLEEFSYQKLRDKGNQVFENASGWFGMTDKYWLTALVPESKDYKVSFSHYMKNKTDRYQVDYLNRAVLVPSKMSVDYKLHLFAGAKELKLLDHYANGNAGDHLPPIPLFDRALDFGFFYFLAKPMCIVVDMLYLSTGNFGVAILLFIVLLKLLLFPLANKSYKSMSQMRALQPEMLKIRERYVDDQIGLHKATRELYKRERINPAAGCLPVLIQIMVFLALFRGLNVSIEMRHAPFYGWIKDLSMPDPSNIFTLFGLVHWDTPSWLHLGILPMLYCATMIVQTRQQPKPADPIQAKMMNFMPFFLLVFFDKMASGFVLYWTWSNMLSIAQQQLITSRYKKSKELKAEKVAANG